MFGTEQQEKRKQLSYLWYPASTKERKKKCKGKWFSYIWFHHEKYGKKNQIYLKLIRNLHTLKLFNLYIKKEKEKISEMSLN